MRSSGVIFFSLVCLVLVSVGCGGEPVASAGQRSGGSSSESRLKSALIEGEDVPTDLPDLSLFTLVSTALPWREDAVPVRLEISEPGRLEVGYRVMLHYYSPSDDRSLIVRVGTDDVSTFEGGRGRTDTVPYPPDFIDFSAALQTAREQGLTGALKRASLMTNPHTGTTWMINTTRAVMSYSAVTGERLAPSDMSWYNDQWDRALAGIRGLVSTAFSALGPHDPERYFQEYEQFVCTKNGGAWVLGSCNP